jgi:hypothetical protein
MFNVLTPVQVLDTLAFAIEEESAYLSFDYFSLHMRCTRLLRALYVEFQEEILALAGPLDEGIGELTLLVRWILVWMVRERQGRLEGSKGRVMRGMVEGEGNVEIEAVRTLMGRSCGS